MCFTRNINNTYFQSDRGPRYKNVLEIRFCLIGSLLGYQMRMRHLFKTSPFKNIAVFQTEVKSIVRSTRVFIELTALDSSPW